MSIDEPHPRATTASIDRRVERLELSQAETSRKVDELGLSMGFLRELINLKFGAMESALDAQASKLDVFIIKMDGFISRGVEQGADLEASPLGRTISRRLTSLEQSRDAHDDELQAVKGFGSGVRQYVLPVIAIIISILVFLNQKGML